MTVYNIQTFTIHALRWNRVVKMYVRFFYSNLNRLTEVFPIIMGFCVPSNPLWVLEIAKYSIGKDFRRRHSGAVINEEIAEEYILKKNQKCPYWNKPCDYLWILESQEMKGNPLLIRIEHTGSVLNSQSLESRELKSYRRVYLAWLWVRLFLSLQQRIFIG